MELIYLWIDEYKNLNNCGVSLNEKYKCEIQKFKDSKNKKLILNVTLSSLKNKIFDSVFNITTIVGKNGSGKSNLVNALSYIIREIREVHSRFSKTIYDKSDLGNSRFVLLFSDDNKNNTEKRLFFYAKNIDVVFDKENQGLNFININAAVNNYGMLEILPKLPYSVAKFHPFLRIEDDDILEFPLWDNIFNTADVKLNNYFYYDRFRLYDSVRSLLELLKFNDLQEQNNILKLFSENNQQLSFNMYSPYLCLYDALKWSNNRIQREKLTNYNITQTVSRSVSTFLSHIRKNTYKKVEDLFPSVLPKLFFTYALGEIICFINSSKSQNLKIKIEPLINNLAKSQYPTKQERIDFYKNIQIYITKKHIKEMLQAYIDFETNNELKEILKDKFEIVFGQKGTVLQLKSDYMVLLDNFENYPDFVTKIESLKGISKNLYKKSYNGKVYDFMSLSTGEQRIIKFFADVYLTLVQNIIVKKSNAVDTNIYIFDEMDLSWHPEWQRKMISYIIDLFDKTIKSFNLSTKFNLIFTTHSPFILSDMPKTNVVYMRNGENMTQMVNLQSFGANIHDLFNCGLFFDCDNCSTMGEFAKNIIQLNILENLKNLNYTNQKEVEDTIKLIGDPLLKKVLLEKLYSNNSYKVEIENIEYLKAKNKKLMNKIKELEKSIDEKN